MTKLWTDERTEEQKVQIILNSLTSDRRIQKDLLDFSHKIADFLEFLKAKDVDFLQKLAVPVFQGSLLLEPKDLEKQRSSSPKCRGTIIR